MGPFLRRSLLGLGLLTLGAAPAASGIPISVPRNGAMAEKNLNQAMQDAFACVAAVLAYRPREAEISCSGLILAAPQEALGYKFRGLAFLLEQRFDKAEEDFH